MGRSSRRKAQRERDTYLEKVYARGEVGNPEAMSADEFQAFAAHLRATEPEMAHLSDAQLKEELKEAISWLAPNPEVASTLKGYMAQQAMAGDEGARGMFRALPPVTDEEIAQETLPEAQECLVAIALVQRGAVPPTKS